MCSGAGVGGHQGARVAPERGGASSLPHQACGAVPFTEAGKHSAIF